MGRIKEPSTYAGIAALLAVIFGLDIAPESVELILVALASVASALAMLLKERGKQPKDLQLNVKSESGRYKDYK